MTELLLIFATVTQTFHLPEGLLSGLCYVESNHKIHAINKNDGGADSVGMCQIKFDTAKSMGYRGDVKTLHHSAALNAHYAGKYLRYQMNRYDQDVKKAIAAYNAGSYIINKNGLPVNRDYVKKVMNAWADQK